MKADASRSISSSVSTSCARQEGHGLGHAIDAAEVAAVGDRDPQIGDAPAERVDHGAVRSCLLRLPPPRLRFALAADRPWRS